MRKIDFYLKHDAITFEHSFFVKGTTRNYLF